MTATEPRPAGASTTNSEDPRGLPRPPMVSGVPYVGSWRMLRDPTAFVEASYREHGPIFRINLMGGEKVVMAGREAAEFFATSDPDLWARRLIFERVTDDLGTADFIPALDGEVREHYRKLMQLGFSREIVGRYEADLFGLTQECVGEWRPGSVHDGVRLLGDLAAAQIGLVTGNCGLTDIAGDIERALLPMFGIPLGLLPDMTLHLPSYKRAKKRIHARFVETLAEHRRMRPGPLRKADVIDLLLQARDESGEALSDLVVFVTTLFGWASGQIYLARYYAFLMYSLLARPDVLERVMDEVAAVWRDGPPRLQDLRRMSALRHAGLECLRHFPIQAVMPFRVTSSFGFHGHRVEAGDLVYFVPMTAHFSADIYTNPADFDIDRFEEPRSEHRLRHAFTTYGVHPRNCVAMGMVELLTLVTFSTLLHERSFALAKPYELKIVLRPVPSPDRGFRLRVSEPVKHEIDDSVYEEIMSRRVSARPLTPIATSAVMTAVTDTRIERFRPGDVVISEGDTAESFYMIVTGQADVVKVGDDGREQALAVLSAGDHFGEVGLIEDCPRTATVRASGNEELSVIVVGREAFRDMVATGDLMSDEIAATVQHRVVCMNLAKALPGLDAGHVDTVLGEHRLVRHNPGDVIIRQGDEARHFYIVNKGRLEVVNHHPTAGDIVLDQLGPGQFFGELGLINSAPRTATVRVLDEPVELIRVDRDTFLELWDEAGTTRDLLGPEIARRLAELAGDGD